MRRDEGITALKAIEPDIRAFGVRSLSIFGYVARDEAEPTSDIDVFVEPGTDAFFALRNYVGAYRRIAEAFPTMQVGYATRDGLARNIREAVDREAVRVF